MKKISILVPCYNEEDNVREMKDTLTDIMSQYEGKYDYEIIFRDNASNDRTLEKLRELSREDGHIKVIVNARNYGMDPKKNTFAGRVSGDAVITIACDFQEPPERIPDFITWWEKGYEVVCGQKTSSKEGRVKYGLRQVYYSIIGRFSDVPQYRNMSGITLVSRRIFELKNSVGDEQYFRFFIADLGCDVKLIPYEQQARRKGKSSYNLGRSLSFAITSLITTSTLPLRLATLLGLFIAVLCLVVGLIYLILKLVFWNSFSAGMAPMLIGVFFIGAVQLFFIGIVGEYVGNILNKVTKNNPPIVKELINFDNNTIASDEYYIPGVNESDKRPQ